MKILLLGDYSNYHACLGQALAKEGHIVTVASDGGGWMKTAKTLSLSRPFPGKVGGAFLYTKMILDSQLKGYDIVSLINPSFIKLQPSRLKKIFNRIKKYNGKVFLGSIGTDKAVMDFLTSDTCSLRYNEYYSSPGNIYEPNRSILEEDTLWQKNKIGEFCEYVYDNVDGVTTALYEYHLAMKRRIPKDKLSYVGIPIDTNNLNIPIKTSLSEKKILFLGRHSYRKAFKGTDRLEFAAKKVIEEYPDKCQLVIIEDQPYSVYIKKFSNADIVLDQLYSYSPATNALLALSLGKTVVSGAEPEFYDFIGETELRPIVNAIPDDEELYKTIRDAVLSKDIIDRSYTEGPEFVRRHNDSLVVAKRHLEFWTSKM